MIIPDTHILIWWVHGDPKLSDSQSSFIRDPADQIIVATAIIYDCPVVTSDEKIRAYPHVATIE